jgi:hypothetical protein
VFFEGLLVALRIQTQKRNTNPGATETLLGESEACFLCGFFLLLARVATSRRSASS